MELDEARGILLTAAAAWASERMAFDKEKFQQLPYQMQKALSGQPQKQPSESAEKSLKLREQVLDAAVLQCARALAQKENQASRG
jgi:hypothetical protein